VESHVLCGVFAASRVSEYLETADEVKLLTRGRVTRLANGNVRFVLYKTKNNSYSVGRPQEIDFPKLEGEEACPASAILSFLKLRESKAYMSYVVSLSRAERATGVQRLVSGFKWHERGWIGLGR
jgi:hypothetical protein